MVVETNFAVVPFFQMALGVHQLPQKTNNHNLNQLSKPYQGSFPHPPTVTVITAPGVVLLRTGSVVLIFFQEELTSLSRLQVAKDKFIIPQTAILY